MAAPCARPSLQFENNLRIFPVEGAFDGELGGVIIPANLPDALVDGLELGVGVTLLSKVQYAHIHVGGFLALYADNTKPQQLGSGVYPQYDAFLVHRQAKIQNFVSFVTKKPPCIICCISGNIRCRRLAHLIFIFVATHP